MQLILTQRMSYNREIGLLVALFCLMAFLYVITADYTPRRTVHKVVPAVETPAVSVSAWGTDTTWTHW